MASLFLIIIRGISSRRTEEKIKREKILEFQRNQKTIFNQLNEKFFKLESENQTSRTRGEAVRLALDRSGQTENRLRGVVAQLEGPATDSISLSLDLEDTTLRLMLPSRFTSREGLGWPCCK